jgi:hypothetical protein
VAVLVASLGGDETPAVGRDGERFLGGTEECFNSTVLFLIFDDFLYSSNLITLRLDLKLVI